MPKVSPLYDSCKYRPRPGPSDFLLSSLQTPPLEAPPLDTLALTGTDQSLRGFSDGQNDDFQVSATTQTDDRKTLLKRARRKFLTDGLSLKLVEASEQNDRGKLKKAYWNTYHCASNLTHMSDGTTRGKYCKNKWCTVCNSIRTARLIEDYGPILDKWEDKYFVTLTAPTVCRLDLKDRIFGMGRQFSRITGTLKKRHQRGQGPRFEGIRKLECTYNESSDEYHPHFHLIVRGEELAKEVANIWLGMNPDASMKAQDVRPADDASCKELFKYFTKLITPVKGKDGKDDRVIYADAMDVIFNAISGQQTFKTFGFELSDYATQTDDTPAEVPAACGEDQEDPREDPAPYATGESTWRPEVTDWVNEDTGECLTGYIPGGKFRDLVECKIFVRPGYDGIHWRRYTNENESGKGNRLKNGWKRKKDIKGG